MILWITLFILVVSVSFVLTALSMRDFSDVLVEKSGYSLFLIRNISNLDKDLLDLIISEINSKGAYISLERLFKGRQSTLVVFGPKKILSLYTDQLGLLELEDYTDVNVENVSGFEVGIKNSGDWEVNPKLFDKIPNLYDTEEFWWQVIISNSSKIQISAVVLSDNLDRRGQLVKDIENLAPDMVLKLPKVFSNSQMLDLYKHRSFRKENKNPKLTPDKLLQLVLI